MTQPLEQSNSVPLRDGEIGQSGDWRSQGSDFAQLRSLKRDLLAELRAGWEQDNPPRPEDLLERWPCPQGDDHDAASLLFEDYMQRQGAAGNGTSDPDISVNPQASVEALLPEYERRFPKQADSLAQLVQHHALLQSFATPGTGKSDRTSSLQLALPGVGDEVFDFRLRHELGRGAFARVFLAEQTGLADRPVVLKVSAIEGDEPQTLAQLQHTNIVPIYSVHDDAKAGLRAVCMPYFGGASLSSVLKKLRAESPRPLSGNQLVEALVSVQTPSWDGPSWGGSPEPSHGTNQSTRNGALEALRGRKYIQTTVWLIARLAQALQHAHERGVLHRDIKPSNILLAADGQPMLLDFNLAQNTHHAQAAATLGGTVAYMSPEHLRALAKRDTALARQVDNRADIYSLGMVLFEMLAGKSPFDQSASYSPLPALIEAMAVERSRTLPSLKSRRGDVPWSLESIARKCLAPDPARRYQQAEHLAEDLQRFLEDRPLKHAPELSWRERAAKWARRHPRLTASSGISGVAAFLLLTGGSILIGTRAELEASQARAYEAEGAEALQRMQAFEIDHQLALCLVNTTTDRKDHIAQGIAACEQALERYGILDRGAWQEHRDWRRLVPSDQRALAEDAREVLLLLARGTVYQNQARADAKEVLQAALALVDRAEAIQGLPPSPALWDDRAYYLRHIGDDIGSATASAKARTLPPAGARDHYWRATSLAFTRQYKEAITELDQALRVNPRHYWSWLQRGICHVEINEQALAVGDFNACIALWPEFAWGYFNRGNVLDQLGKKSEALADYTLALGRDPDLTSAYLNRALVYLDTGRPAPALADLDQAAAKGADDVNLHAGRGLALEALGRHQEADKAFQDAWQRDSENVPMLVAYGFAISQRSPQKARAAFAKALERQPRNTRAIYGLGMLAAARARASQEALTLFTLAVEVDPSFIEARRSRANVLAHRAEWELARQEIDWCVKTDPSAPTLYAAACVYSLTAAKNSNAVMAKWSAERAIELLAAALERGYGREVFASDDDLAGIRSHPKWVELRAMRFQ
jgi:eukaryotic-like serine/threonine-protein kinase